MAIFGMVPYTNHGNFLCHQLGSIERPMAMKKRGTGVAVAAQAEGLRRTVSGWWVDHLCIAGLGIDAGLMQDYNDYKVDFIVFRCRFVATGSHVSTELRL